MFLCVASRRREAAAFVELDIHVVHLRYGTGIFFSVLHLSGLLMRSVMVLRHAHHGERSEHGSTIDLRMSTHMLVCIMLGLLLSGIAWSFYINSCVTSMLGLYMHVA